MISESIQRIDSDRIATVSFNRPDRRNALDNEMYRALAAHLHDIDRDPALRVLLLTGTGSYFNSGNLLSEFVGFTTDMEFVPARFLRALAEFSKPIVVAIEGGAIGVGATMLLHCDVVYAGRSSRFQMPFARFGLCPEGASSLLLPRNAGHKQAVRWLLLGEDFSAEEAINCGLVTMTVADGKALDHALDAAQRLAEQPFEALHASRRLLRRAEHEQVADTIEDECHEFAALLAAPEAQAALKHFLARKK